MPSANIERTIQQRLPARDKLQLAAYRDIPGGEIPIAALPRAAGSSLAPRGSTSVGPS